MSIFFEKAFLNPPSAPFFSKGKGGISADALLKREM
jgi:hypothetical protein